MGQPQSASVIGNADPTTLQLLTLLQGLITELRRTHRWKACEWEYIIEVSPSVTLTGNVGANSGHVTSISPGTAGDIPPLLTRPHPPLSHPPPLPLTTSPTHTHPP